MNALDKFSEDLNRTLNSAMAAQVPLETIIFTLDLAHDEMLVMRRRAIAQQQVEAQTRGIIAAKTMPNGREVHPPGMG